MNNKKTNKIIVTWIFFIVVISQIVLSLGVHPAKTIIEPGFSESYADSFWIVNNDGVNMKLKISASGMFAQYLDIENSEISFQQGEKEKRVNFKFYFPDDFPSGTVEIPITIEEVPNLQDLKTVTSAHVKLTHKLIIITQYPDKYVEFKVNVQEVGDQFMVSSEVENKGQKDIQNIQATYYVSDSGSVLAKLDSNQESLLKGESTILSSYLDKDVLDNGEFEISASVVYDGNIAESAESLIYGKPEIEVTYFDKYFVENIINPYTLELFNKWNKKIENVFVDIVVEEKDQDNSVEVNNFRTRSVDISSDSREKIEGYYDATGEDKGDYIFRMVVNYWNSYKMDSQDFEVKILGEDEDYNSIVGGAVTEPANNLDGSYDSQIQDVKAKDGINIPVSVIIFIILAIIIINGIIITILIRRKRADEW